MEVELAEVELAPEEEGLLVVDEPDTEDDDSCRASIFTPRFFKSDRLALL